MHPFLPPGAAALNPFWIVPGVMSRWHFMLERGLASLGHETGRDDLSYGWGCKQAPESGRLRQEAPGLSPPLTSLGVSSSWPGGPWRTLSSGWVQGRWDWISGVMNIHQLSRPVYLAGRGWVSGSP